MKIKLIDSMRHMTVCSPSVEKNNRRFGVKDYRGITVNQVQMKSIIQMGRAQEIVASNDANYVVKMNFAGSGYGAWNKEGNPKGYGRKEFVKKFASVANPDPFTSIYGTKEGNYNRIYKKEKSEKEHIYSISGPRWFWGASDNGYNSIAKNIENGTEILDSEISRRHSDNSELYILIKGHSRGGVAAGRVAQIIKSKYPHRSNLHIELVQYDPVPGPCHSGRNTMLDFNKDYSDKSDSVPSGDHSDGAEVHPVDFSSTLIYSINSGHPFFFTPQQVLGADRIILSDRNHTSGLDTIPSGGRHKIGFKKDDENYLGSGINKLLPGVYWATGEILQSINTVQELQEHLDQTRTLQSERKEVIKTVVEHKFSSVPTAIDV